MRGFKLAAIIYVVAEFFLTPSLGVVQSHAQSGPIGPQPAVGDAFAYQKNDTPPQDTMIVGPFMTNRLLPNLDGSINARLPSASGSGKGGSFTLSNASATVLPPAGYRQSLAIDNESASIAIACAFGGTAAINTGGSWTIPAGATRTWPIISGGFVPNDAINCIAASGSPTITISVQ